MRTPTRIILIRDKAVTPWFPRCSIEKRELEIAIPQERFNLLVTVWSSQPRVTNSSVPPWINQKGIKDKRYIKILWEKSTFTNSKPPSKEVPRKLANKSRVPKPHPLSKFKQIFPLKNPSVWMGRFSTTLTQIKITKAVKTKVPSWKYKLENSLVKIVFIFRNWMLPLNIKNERITVMGTPTTIPARNPPIRTYPEAIKQESIIISQLGTLSYRLVYFSSILFFIFSSCN